MAFCSIVDSVRPVVFPLHRSFVLLASCAFAVPLSSVALSQTGGRITSQLELPRSEEVAKLNTHLARLADAPNDVEALIGAGESALVLDDPRAAVGFFGRADDAAPGRGRIKAGLGRAMLGLGQNSDALRLLEEAEKLGWTDASLYSDRGLARDLAGDALGAQRDYLVALRSRPNDAVLIRRYAVSLGIAGQVEQAEKAIQPLLYKSDRGAWRDRAFILAMNGKRDQARSITRQVMPGPLAEAIQPYMERMEVLNPAQRAAAVHLGQFPPGLVTVKMASGAASPPTAASASSSAAAPVAQRPMPQRQAPAAAPPVRTVQASPQPQLQRSAPVQGPPASITVAAPTSRSRVPPEIDYGKDLPIAAAAAGEPVRSAPVTSIAAPQPAPSRAPTAAPAPAPVAQPAAASVVSPAAPSAPQASPIPAQAASPAPLSPVAVSRTLAQIMAEIEVPETEQASAVAPVDLAEIARLQAEQRKLRLATEARAKKDTELKAKKAAEEKAKAEALAEKKRLAASPSRVWVQIGTGRNKGALAFTLKAMRKQYAEQIGKREGWTAAWGRTNRLVVGPFASVAKAREFEAAMSKAGSDAFVWQSDAGEEVAVLGGK